jgi:alanine racemase
MPAMELQAEIYGVRHLAAGSRLGYGGTFIAERDMRVGLLRCGYADGYPRGIGADCPVSINGKPSRILGKVSMDTLTIDLGRHPLAAPGDRVSLWGTETLPVETIARSAGTIGAQLCTALTARVPRLAAVPSSL